MTTVEMARHALAARDLKDERWDRLVLTLALRYRSTKAEIQWRIWDLAEL